MFFRSAKKQLRTKRGGGGHQYEHIVWSNTPFPNPEINLSSRELPTHQRNRANNNQNCELHPVGESCESIHDAGNSNTMQRSTFWVNVPTPNPSTIHECAGTRVHWVWNAETNVLRVHSWTHNTDVHENTILYGMVTGCYIRPWRFQKHAHTRSPCIEKKWQMTPLFYNS